MSLESNRSLGETARTQAPAPPLPPKGTRTSAASPEIVSFFPGEKRRYPRFKWEGNLELKTEGSTIRSWATLTDISTTGCYIEIMTTFAIGTKVEVRLGMNGFLLNGAGIVRATYPFLGMGIEFTNLSQNSREQLDAMIASVTAKRAQTPPAQKKMMLPPISEPMSALNALEQFFEENAALSAEEFVKLVTASQGRKP
jgi:PilZ domain